MANLYVTSLFQFSDWVPSLSLNTGANDSQGTVWHCDCALGGGDPATLALMMKAEGFWAPVYFCMEFHFSLSSLHVEPEIPVSLCEDEQCSI